MPTPAGFASLLDGPSPATLTTYRANGSAVGSPVWFQVRADAVEVVIAEDDIKLRHLAKNPTCSVLIFESVSPFRGLRVDGEPTLRDTDLAAVREAIASKYLGAEKGRLFAQQRGPGVVLSLPLDQARTWDLAAILP